MKRQIFIPLLTVILGAVACVVRLLERLSAYDAATGLTNMANPFARLLVALTVVVILISAGLAIGRWRTFIGGYDDAFYAPTTMHVTMVVLAGVVLLGAGILAFLDYRADQELYRYGLTQTGPSIVQLLLSILSLASGVCLFPVGKNNYRAGKQGKQFILLLAPAFMACFWLVCSYLEESGNPDLMTFVFSRMAAITSLLALYYICSFSFEKSKPRRFTLFAMLGIFFSFISLVDNSPLYLRMLGLFSILFLTAQLSAIGWNSRGVHLPKHPTPEVPTDEQ